MICEICKEDYKWHFNSRFCWLDCKEEWKRLVRRKYNQSDKWKDAMIRWHKNPKRIETEKKYRNTDNAKVLAVERSMRCLKNNEHLQVKKKQRDKQHWYKRRALIKELWNIDFIALKEKFEELWNKCLYCWCLERIEIDHIKPLSKWGTNDLDNLQPLCKSCNSSKWNKYESKM